MAICKVCGVRKAGLFSDLCVDCMDKPEKSSPTSQPVAPPDVASDTTRTDFQEQGSASTCITLGVMSLLIGLYFLADPTTASSSAYGSVDMPQIANIHKLTLGETFSIMGAIFLAAGLRPRR
jgi:hypothetical protein